ncbi:transporter family ABC domain protein (macronuclear) [Tetrahymena thermophila SB210]|uniref:Transporter family ABC domain protein n=1 Tax=Tetrahymena thermophila (strain SB210) TaxID=312017 RepID=I7MEA2_TETTS|nr:transporter family ABC domain protein [Tetrahymena thermophila SB210]EAR95943.2 transporter family ABC domain protein [Tetrahymena thermophila SB210]|eukprot:XP_001016188.2 transporter family ABC domain protein [Tetrahymena thermophila SB210]
MLDQIRVVFLKNYIVLVRSKVFIQSIYVPILCTLFSCLAQNVDSLAGLKTLWPMYQCMSINGYIRYASMEIVQEKKDQQRENQKIMGLTHWNYMMGQLLFSTCICVIIGIFYYTACSIGGVYEGINFMKGIILYIAFVIAMVCKLYFLTSFFTSQKLASDIISLVNLFFSFVYIFVLLSDVRNDKIFIILLSLAPQAALTLGLMGDGWSILNKLSISFVNFSVDEAILVLLFDIAVYLLLYLYLDQIWPNEYGTQKSPLFIFQSIKKLCCKQQSQSQQQQNATVEYVEFNDLELASQNFDREAPLQQQVAGVLNQVEDKSSALYHQQIDTSNLVKSLQISNLTKHFHGYYAVKQLTLSLYEGQIFCLLGHNGAGKTTTINLITGMIQKSHGQVTMNGLDLDKDLDEIRRSIGLCSQKNILYDNLTVEDHLWFYARIKLIPDQIIQEDIQNIISKCNLHNERFKYAQHLSGGNKRKLCLAIALIGKSKFIFLDEPTSGVDVITRRQIWDILREVKNEGRIIILTTHHLEEAEALADRIGIMAQGQLLCLGTVDYIIHKFGVGYFLKVQSKSENETEINQFIQKKAQLESIVKHYIPNCQKDPQTQEQSLKFLLPFSSTSQFSDLFKQLESDRDIMINLQINSLEDVFVSIGTDEQRYFNLEQQQQQQQRQNDIGYSDFSNIQIPEFLKDEPFFSFQTQTQVIAIRRIKMLFKNPVQIISYIFPFTIIGIGYFFAHQAKDSFEVFQIFVTIAICFICNSTGTTFIIEREKNLLYTLRVMGCKLIPYWFGTFIIDFILAMFYFLVVIIIAYYCNIRSVVGENFQHISYKSFVTVFTGVATSYSYSYMFEKSYTAYMAFPLFQLFVNFYLGLAFILLSAKFSPCQIISYVFFPLGVNSLGIDNSKDPESMPVLYFGYSSLNTIALISSILHLIFAMYLEKSQILSYCKRKNQFTPIVQIQRDPDVIQEEQRSSSQIDPITARNISKQYDNQYLAINGISFGVQKKQIFGLLGPNGAGKTTTFNILTAKDSSSSGQVFVNQEQAIQTNENAWQNVGICSQFDNLWDDLTVYDHLALFASLKGLQGEKRERAIKYFTQTLQLEAYIDRKSEILSGGNKRKLCVGMALIGSPNVQFFDEPSSGLDPIAKRFLWNTLKQNLQLKDASIVLTTHSMNEAESLCSKIGIVVNGQFQCMGSPEHLSNKYGQGYRLKLIKNPNCFSQEIDSIILNSFQNAIKIIDQEKTLIYQIPTQYFIFSRVFDLVENNLKNKIEQYSIHHTNLEQIFSYFATFQQQFIDPPISQSEVQVCSCEGMNALRWCTMCCCCCVW